MEKSEKIEWAKKMLELDLKGQSGSIWTEEKSGNDAEKKIKQYSVNENDGDVLLPDPVFYNGKIIKSDCIDII